MAKYIERAYGIGVKDGKAGDQPIALEELQKPGESPAMRTIGQYAHTAYRAGYRAGEKR